MQNPGGLRLLDPAFGHMQWNKFINIFHGSLKSIAFSLSLL